MPYDCYQDFSCKRPPTEEEVKAIYDWIKSLALPSLPPAAIVLIDECDRDGHCRRSRPATGSPA
jgi:hypothetical protein